MNTLFRKGDNTTHREDYSLKISMSFKEEFLHYVWKYKRFDHRNLITTNGNYVSILNYGNHNLASGPDFHNALIRIDDINWAGNVEIHRLSSDWNRHKHQYDKAYDNVVLHVVYEHDKEIENTKNQKILTLELKSRIALRTLGQYNRLQTSRSWIPCETQFHEVDSVIVQNSIDRALLRRLERKSNYLMTLYSRFNNDWNKTIYIMLALAFGAKINSASFEQLARVTPLDVISKCRENLSQLEALFLGQAGMLEGDILDEYHLMLRKEYKFLKHKFRLTPMKRESWKFSGVRPASFPIIRIAQFATLWSRTPSLYSEIVESKNISQLEVLFQVQLNGYWLTHYNFMKRSKSSSKRIGRSLLDNIIINTVVPFLFAFSELRKENNVRNKAMLILESVRGERNSIVSRWSKLGVTADSAQVSQGLLELKNEFCTFKKCLQCPIGVGLLKN